MSATAAVLFDRDGTLVENVPYNGDPALVRPMATAVAALESLRGKGIHTGVVTNQSELDVVPERIVVIGDIESDVLAALAAGARAVMVPTAATRREEIDRSPLLAADLLAAVKVAVR